ncbi:hypothetical protein [Sinorhizobium meliloti]|uniref:hypothetical protein n=1 Tax=Rhizobium meliloti TaxID=382 RepID=UPI0020916D24|nr:hypothetical protein [Sinorhizobium meliloti]MCO5963665.1 hypothetical protein [Sinorhizobium meliloti]
MRQGTFAQDKSFGHCYSRALARIMLKFTDRPVIVTFGLKQCIQIELDRMKSQQPLRKVLTPEWGFTNLSGSGSILRCEAQNVSHACCFATVHFE